MVEATGGNIDGKKDEKPKVIVKQYVRDFIDNPLHDYESYNAVFTLAALTVEEVNFPNLLYNRMPLHPIAHSTGKGKIEEVTFYKQAGVNLEYFIDNVEVESQVSPSPKTKFTQKDKIRFTVTEPYSIGLFFRRIFIVAPHFKDLIKEG